MSCIIETIDLHKSNLKSKNGTITQGKITISKSVEAEEKELPSPTTSGKFIQMNANNQTNDTDDSGFDTSDSSDEKKKQLTAKVKIR